jgi:hypothetical protein
MINLQIKSKLCQNLKEVKIKEKEKKKVKITKKVNKEKKMDLVVMEVKKREEYIKLNQLLKKTKREPIKFGY